MLPDNILVVFPTKKQMFKILIKQKHKQIFGIHKQMEIIIVTHKPVCCKPSFHKLKVMLFKK